MEFIISDLFDKVDGKFDSILFNPPYLPVNEEGILEKAWSGGENGSEITKRFIKQSRGYLKQDGLIQILASSLNDITSITEFFSKEGFKADVTNKKKFFFEELYVLTASIR